MAPLLKLVFWGTLSRILFNYVTYCCWVGADDMVYWVVVEVYCWVEPVYCWGEERVYCWEEELFEVDVMVVVEDDWPPKERRSRYLRASSSFLKVILLAIGLTLVTSIP